MLMTKNQINKPMKGKKSKNTILSPKIDVIFQILFADFVMKIGVVEIL